MAVGSAAGGNCTGSNNVYIGSGIQGLVGESNVCYIGSIFGQTGVDGAPVFVNSSNKLGTTTSSKRFKRDIKPIDKISETLSALKPVSFRYKRGIDPNGEQQLGLVAEDVEKVSPNLVIHDTKGKPYTVRYDQVNAMLLNEFLKEHKVFDEQKQKVQKLEATVATLVLTVKEQAAQIQKVSMRADTSRPVSRVAMADP